MKTDEELSKTFKLETDESGILVLTFFGEEREPETNARQAELVIAGLKQFFADKGEQRYSLLVDLTPIESANYVSDKAREIYLKSDLTKHIGKSAIISTSILLKVFIIFIAQALGKPDSMKLFADKQEAVAWLKA